MSYTTPIMRLLAILAVVAGSAGVAGAQPSARPASAEAEADRLVSEAEALARGGQFAEAVARFKAAEAIFPRPIHDCYIALAYHRMARHAQAASFVARCQAEAAAGGDKLPDWADRLGPKIWQALSAGGYGRVTITTTPAEADVAVDSFAPDEVFAAGDFWLAPGQHTFTVTHTGYVTKTEVVTVADKEKVARAVELLVAVDDTTSPIIVPPPGTEPLTRPRPVWAYVSLASGAALLLAGGIYHYKAAQTHDEAETSAMRYDEVIDRFRTERVLAISFYTAGAVATGVGVYLLWRHAAQAPPMAGVSVSGDGAQVWAGWSF